MVKLVKKNFTVSTDSKEQFTSETSRRQKAQRVIQGLNGKEKTFSKNFVIITASNPNGSLLPRRHNREANELLEKDLNCRYVKVKGKYNDLEDSYICFDLPIYQAKFLAKKYEQEAFIVGKYNNEGDIIYDYYKSNKDGFGNLLGTYNVVDTSFEIEDVTKNNDCYTQLCRRFKYKIKFPSFENKIDLRVRRLFQDNNKDTPVKIIFNDNELDGLLAEATNSGILQQHRRVAKNLLKRHYEALGIKPPKECY